MSLFPIILYVGMAWGSFITWKPFDLIISFLRSKMNMKSFSSHLPISPETRNGIWSVYDLYSCRILFHNFSIVLFKHEISWSIPNGKLVYSKGKNVYTKYFRLNRWTFTHPIMFTSYTMSINNPMILWASSSLAQPILLIVACSVDSQCRREYWFIDNWTTTNIDI